MTSEKKDELIDAHVNNADFIKEDVLKIVSIAMCDGDYRNYKVELFNAIASIDQSLEKMWDAFASYRSAYDSLEESYEKLNKETAEES